MSGIYIPGMEMPTSCRACPLATRFFDGEDVCAMLGTYVHDRDREDDCPLIPVPEHGRLVCDREVKWAFDDAIMNEAQQTGKVRATSDEIAKIISNVKTVIPAEEGE